jgi:hypothetical protein
MQTENGGINEGEGSSSGVDAITSDSDHPDDQQHPLAKMAPFDGIVLILSEAGKPIFYRFFYNTEEFNSIL